MSEKTIYIIDNIVLFNKNTGSNPYVKFSYADKNVYSKYDKIIFFTYNIKDIIEPLKKLSILYSNNFGKKIVVQDNFNNEIKLSLAFLVKLFFKYSYDSVLKNKLLSDTEKEISLLEKSSNVKNLSFKGKPMYIKVPLNFGVPSGGAVTHATGVINSLRNVYKRPVIFTTDCFGKEVDDIKKILIHMERYNDFRELQNMYFNKTAYRYIERKKVKGFSFIYQRVSLYSFVGIKLAEKYRVPLISEYNSSDVWIRKFWGSTLIYSNLANRIEKLNFDKSDLLVCVSEELKNELVSKGISENKILVNYNGVNTEKYKPYIDNSKVMSKYGLNSSIVIGFVGSFDKFHGTGNLAKAFNLLLKEYPKDTNIKLLLIGEGIEKKKVEAILRRSVADGSAIFTGSIPYEQVPAHLSACDILVAPHVPNKDKSPFFGSPTKLFEYMAMGKGIVASDLNQIGRILKNEETALLVEPDNVEQLMIGIKRLIDDKKLRETLGQNARKEVEKKYTWDINVKNVLDKLKDLYYK